jgi:hypothetical protein
VRTLSKKLFSELFRGLVLSLLAGVGNQKKMHSMLFSNIQVIKGRNRGVVVAIEGQYSTGRRDHFTTKRPLYYYNIPIKLNHPRKTGRGAWAMKNR